LFNNLIKIKISMGLMGDITFVLIDNLNKTITVNDVVKINNIDEYNEFLLTFFRIIREWENEYINESLNDSYLLNINIIEKENNYVYKIKNAFPDNFDSFLSLIETIIN